MQNALPIAERMAFLVYDSRSGSTHLASLLDTHPEFCMSLESEFLLNAYKESAETPVSGPDLARLVAEDAKLHDWAPGVGELALDLISKDSGIDAEALMERLFEAVLDPKKPGARWLALKQGLLADHLPRLLKRWPKAAIIHIYRDGRGVFNSKRKFKNIDTGLPMQSDPKKAANRWVKVMRAFDWLPSSARVVQVAFESLITDQDRELARIFTELDLTPEKARPENAGTYAGEIPSKQRGLHPLVGKAPDLSRIDVWKSELTARQLREYDAIAGSMLKAKGYQPYRKPFLSDLSRRLFSSRTREERSPA